MEVHVHDPVADPGEAKKEYGFALETWDSLPVADALVVAVAHGVFRERPLADYAKKLVAHGCLIDVKSIFDMQQAQALGMRVWRL
jgi:UDP-N-acetyl-D-galactosamine dehydrogenase